MRESHAKTVGYLGMLGESALALCVTLAIAAGVSYGEYASLLVRPADAPAGWNPNPVLAFSVGVAGICESGLGIPRWLGLVFGLLMVEGFVLDTLDVAIRLNRYLIEEIWAVTFRKVPAILRNYWTNSGISVLLMLLLAFTHSGEQLWQVFGSGNQLLASLSLITVSVWLYRQRRRTFYVFVPAILVGVTTMASLVYQAWSRFLPKGKYLLAATAVLFLLLAVGYVVLALRAWRPGLARSARPAGAA
jgi:carbon starvation protein